jgi:chromosome segregation ATPase
MNNDDKIQKQMEFILNQQARFDANIGRLDEKNAQIQEKHVQLQNIVERLATVTLQGFEALEGKSAALIDAQIKTEATIASLTEKMTALAEAQAQTDDRLNTLINVVERQISEGRNGGPQP